MKRKLLILLAVALVVLSGTAACGGVEQEIRQRANDEVDKGRTRVEQEVTKRVGEGAREAEQRAREGVKQGRQQLEGQ